MAKPDLVTRIKRVVKPVPQPPTLTHPFAVYADPDAEPPTLTEGRTERTFAPGERVPASADNPQAQLAAAKVAARVDANRALDRYRQRYAR